MPYGDDDDRDLVERERVAERSERVNEDADLFAMPLNHAPLKPGEIAYICHDCAFELGLSNQWWSAQQYRPGCDRCARVPRGAQMKPATAARIEGLT